MFEQVISQSKIENGILKLPDIQLDRNEYLAIAKKLEFLGGKWKTNKKGFIFDREITIKSLLSTVENKENKKDLQFFPTPSELAKYLVELAELDKEKTVLEPSAGRGAIIKAIQENSELDNPVFFYEISNVNLDYLKGWPNTVKLGEDFLKHDSQVLKFDRIIANPPFAKNQDIQHIMKMWDVLADGGILVSVASSHWNFGKEKKCQNFRKFLETVAHEIEDIEAGVFKESGTMIGAKIIKIHKPAF